MRTENSWEKTALHDFECFPLFTWLRIQFQWRMLAFLLVEVARNWKHKDMQNENKLAEGFEAKNNLVFRVQVLTKGSGSGAGKYLIWYGLNLSIDTVFWSFTIWALYSTWVWKKEELYLFCQIPAGLWISELCFMHRVHSYTTELWPLP